MSLLEVARQRLASPESVENQTRREAQEIVRAYRHSWDVYGELLQNSVDAINRRFRVLNDPDFFLYERFRDRFPNFQSDTGYYGRISLTINVPRREIEVCDNGVGIEHELIEEFLLPEGSDKVMGQEYGFKGFGLTYVAFISDQFHIASRFFAPSSNTKSYKLGLDGLFGWLSAQNGTPTFPAGPVPEVRASDDLDSEWNTRIKIKLNDDYVTHFPAVSSVEQAIKLVDAEDKLEGFEFILRTRTAIGNTKALFHRAPIVPIDIKLKVIIDENEPAIERTIPYRYYHPKEHDEVAFLGFDFDDYYENYKRPAFNRAFRALHYTAIDETIGVRNPISCDISLTAISSTRLSHIQSRLHLDDIQSGDVGVTYGVYLAIDGMPTGLRIDDWDTKGSFLRRFYVVVDAKLDISNQLDPGRKGISKHYARLISEYARELVGSARVADSDPFSSYASKNLDHGRGPQQGGLPPQDFQIKLRQVRDSTERQRNEQNELLQQLKAVSHLNHFPLDEQEVVALFYELQAQKYIKRLHQ